MKTISQKTLVLYLIWGVMLGIGLGLTSANVFSLSRELIGFYGWVISGLGILFGFIALYSRQKDANNA